MEGINHEFDVDGSGVTELQARMGSMEKVL